MSTVIVSAARTPIGSFGGALSTVPAPQLGATAIKAALERAGITPDQVSEVVFGNVLTAGIGQAPARQAALAAGIPQDVPCTTVGKVCGSGMKAVMLADQMIRCGDADIVVAGGQESMSMAPYLLDKARTGYRVGNGAIIDSMMHDGLTDAYASVPMGNFADECAVNCDVPREAQDAFAIESYRRAQSSIAEGRFKEEIVPVAVKDRKGETIVDTDEDPAKTNFEKIPTLRPAFTKEGTVTAANASKINDGAAALVLASEEKARELGLKPMARIVAQSSAARAPKEFTTAPIDAIRKVLDKTGLTVGDIDLFEINEAFAVVALASSNALGIPAEKLNVNGGAVALGHPIGASGARILTTLLHAMKQRNAKRGLAAICIGGGEATALVIESID
jgi:acetyl-CoA C-acetyltransferase